jgi:tetratricopeptide (TPR) repeat protein
MEAHLGTILGTGAITVAAELVARADTSDGSFAVEVIQSRVARNEGDAATVMRHAKRAYELAPNSELVAINLAGGAYFAGDVELAMELARQLAASPNRTLFRDIGVALALMMESSVGGNVQRIATHLEDLAVQHRASGHVHYEGVSLLNAALMHQARGDAEAVLRDSSAAIDALREGSSVAELGAAIFARSWALAWQGDLDGARRAMREIGDSLRFANRAEYFYESANLESGLGDLDEASAALVAYPLGQAPPTYREMYKVPEAVVELRRGNLDRASSLFENIQPNALTGEPGRKSRVLAHGASLAVLGRRTDARDI